ncbi:hypothetical protein [Bacillus cereus]
MIGCSWFVFDLFLTMWNNTYKEIGKGILYYFLLLSLCNKKEKL